MIRIDVIICTEIGPWPNTASLVSRSEKPPVCLPGVMITQAGLNVMNRVPGSDLRAGTQSKYIIVLPAVGFMEPLSAQWPTAHARRLSEQYAPN